MKTRQDILSLDTSAARVRRMRQNVLTSARMLQHGVTGSGGARRYVAMVTLTYREGVEWSPNHVREFLHRMRAWAGRRGLRIPYVWVAELTQRGKLHYHCLLWLPHGVRIPKPDRKGWWTHGMTQIEAARNSVGYIAKYASKATGDQTFPRGARISGCSKLENSDALCRRWWLLPQWLRNHFGPSDDLRRAIGGGWVSRVTGEWFASPWGLVSCGRGSVALVQIGPLLPPRLDHVATDPLMPLALAGCRA